MGKIILASISPRRRELLARIGFTDVEICPSEVEESLDISLSPSETASHWSREKALAAAARYSPEDIVIAGDTVVCIEDRILGKPKDKNDAFDMLSMLSGKTHHVYTGITVCGNGRCITEAEKTAVKMRDISPDEIRLYIATGEPMDKAGAYGIQQYGALLCERIDGDFYNVMGLPLFRLGVILRRLGADPLTALH